MSDQLWLTIVTVVKDAPSEMARTLASLLNQDLSGTEYCVIDSSADTAQVSAMLSDSALDAEYQWVPAAGVYAAMNSGLASATGRYIYFLNAGDELLPDTLARVRETAEQRNALFARGQFAPHQGTFASTDELREVGGFDVSYRIAADYSAFLKLTTKSTPVMLDFPIARFHEGGLSTQRWQESFREFHRARRSILQPRGTEAARELFATGRQFVAVGFYRGVWSKVARHDQ